MSSWSRDRSVVSGCTSLRTSTTTSSLAWTFSSGRMFHNMIMLEKVCADDDIVVETGNMLARDDGVLALSHEGALPPAWSRLKAHGDGRVDAWPHWGGLGFDRLLWLYRAHISYTRARECAKSFQAGRAFTATASFVDSNLCERKSQNLMGSYSAGLSSLTHSSNGRTSQSMLGS